ncbi:Alpha/beta hydrolase fold-1 [Mycena vitilis]|nr:Alpha/beta hydrolase fold-1 [Mycena vitilis]
MSTTKPTIIIIPASFSPISLYTAVISDLRAHGYPVHGIELETVGRREKAPGMYDDAVKVASVVTRLADEGKDVVLAPHSYGGVVACEASKGLAKSLREKDGKQGGIIRIVFVSAVVPQEGQSLLDVLAGEEVNSTNVELQGEYLVLDPPRTAQASYSELAPEEGLSWASRMSEHGVASMGQKITYAAYKDIPVSYLFCEEDKGVLPSVQNKIIAGMESVMGGRSVDRHLVRVGHHINVTKPKVMAAVIRKAPSLGDTA